MFDPRSTLTQQVSRELEEHFGEQGLSHHHPAQRASGRGAVLRQAGDRLRPQLQGRAGLSAAGAGDSRSSRRQVARWRRPRDWESSHETEGLGRGLDALLAGNDAQNKEQQRSLPVADIQPGKYQPRTHMDSASLEELAASIRVQG
jgi:hypothetical protein